MKIGSINIENNVFLAPMAGVTDMPFRKMCKKFGCGLVYSEMVSAKGLYYGDKKTGSLMKLDRDEQPAAIQIFGSDPEIMGKIISQVEEFSPILIDINMGCPTPKIVNNGDGSALMKKPELAGKIIRSAVDNSTLPITVKIRKGWDKNSINAVQIAKIAEENGASLITVHGRTREQLYTGKADWDIIKEVVNAVNIPVIGNGDIFTAENALHMLEYTGCSGIMVARGAQGNPFIFRQINEMLEKGKCEYQPSPEEKITCAITLLSELVKEKGESRGIKESRKHIAWFIKGLRGSAELKNKIFTLSDWRDVEYTLNEYLSKHEF